MTPGKDGWGANALKGEACEGAKDHADAGSHQQDPECCRSRHAAAFGRNYCKIAERELHNFAQERNWTTNLQLGTMLFVLEFEGWTGGSMKFQQIR
jgi:hypothetical protein